MASRSKSLPTLSWVGLGAIGLVAYIALMSVREANRLQSSTTPSGV